MMIQQNVSKALRNEKDALEKVREANRLLAEAGYSAGTEIRNFLINAEYRLQENIYMLDEAERILTSTRNGRGNV